MKKLSTIVFVILALQNIANAQFGNSDVLTIETFLSQDKIKPGDDFKIGVKIFISGEWHINSHKPTEEFLIPTEIQVDSTTAYEIGQVHYPDEKMVKFSFSETPLSVYEGEIIIWAEAKASESFDSDSLIIQGTFSYQACNDQVCMMPTDKSFRISVVLAGKDEAASEINSELFPLGGFNKLQGERTVGKIDRLISGQGMFVTLLSIFLGGLALNLTPCVYPIIPITISFFAGQSSGKISKSFMLALIYVFGMSITYSALGVTAALTGGLLGSSLQNPLVLIGIAAVFLVFAASMFGAFEITIPAFLNNLAGGSRQGMVGSLFMGLTVGIVAAPCIGPFVLSLLTYVAAQGDPALGFTMFFILSLGLGLPYLILGTFSGSIKNLPRSGEWMLWVKKVFGVIMIAVAIYFVSTLLPETIYTVFMTATLIVGGLYVGFFEKSKAGFHAFSYLKKGIGFALLLYGVWIALSAWQHANKEKVVWQTYNERAIQQAKTEKLPVLIDFYADWCLPCKEIDNKLFTAPVIVAEAKKFTTLKADLTNEDSQFVTDLRLQYNVLGVPTIILLNADGVEYRRFTDELVHMHPNKFLQIMRKTYSTQP